MLKKGCFFAFLFLSFLVSGQEDPGLKDFLLGKFDYKNSTDFELVDKAFSVKPLYLNSTVYAAFREMHAEAKKENITLKILSATRNFAEQKAIWEKKWKRLEALEPLERAKFILEYSAMPATSRHHWGTDIDLNNLENSYFEEGKGKTEYDWLVKNAAKFGFYQVYTSREEGRTGYQEEKWHWSYLPLASQYLADYNKYIQYEEIAGFEGSDLARDKGMIEFYVNGISSQLKLPHLLATNFQPAEEISAHN